MAAAPIRGDPEGLDLMIELGSWTMIQPRPNRRPEHHCGTNRRVQLVSLSIRLRSIVLFLAIPTAPAVGAQSTPAVPRLTAAVRAAVIDSAVARLESTYVEADTGRLIGRRLRAQLEAGGYSHADNPAELAELVTRDLRSLNGDLHLSLRYAPSPGQGGRAGPPAVTRGS